MQDEKVQVERYKTRLVAKSYPGNMEMILMKPLHLLYIMVVMDLNETPFPYSFAIPVSP